MTITLTETTIQSGTELFIPLNKLKPSPRNARKTPHSAAHIEALAASIAVKGILQNLVVEPEMDEEGKPTGFYFVTIGEGRRQAMMLRAKRKEIKKAEPVRCVLDTEHDAHEISLDENVTREAMHPADQFEAFQRLAEEKGWGAEEIGARFGVSAHTVKQRLRLGSVSPRLMQAYRDGGLTLDQLTGFAVTEDHARQEQVFDSLSSWAAWNRNASSIRQAMMESHVGSNDKRALFVGVDAYEQAGGRIVRDLFSEGGEGYFEDAALLNRLALAKLKEVAQAIRGEGWKWVEVFLSYPHDHGMRRVYPQIVERNEEEKAALLALEDEYDTLAAEYGDEDERPEAVAQRRAEIEAKIDRFAETERVFRAEDVARGGAIVSLSHGGEIRIERGLIRAEDEEREPETETDETGEATKEEGGIKLLPENLIQDLTTHRTLALRLALGEHPDMALIALTHALAEKTFYDFPRTSVLEIQANSAHLRAFAQGINETAPARALAERHIYWTERRPKSSKDLWDFIVSLDTDERMKLLAHCAALSLNAIKTPRMDRPGSLETSDKLAEAINLDMATHWTPTAESYFGRVTKAHILEAVTEAVGEDAANRIEGMKKQAMAQEAERLVAGTKWLPTVLRGPEQPTQAEPEDKAYPMAAE